MNSEIQKKVILLVEDNKGHQELFRIALKKTRIEQVLYIANDGNEALTYLFQQDGNNNQGKILRPDLIFLDLNLPDICGIEVLKSIKNNERLKVIPVIVLTSSDDKNDRMEAYALGADAYFNKPIEYEKLMEIMCEAKQL